ncbi:MAG: hypothetical protein IKY83_09200 [Proteobacteria bacterium]|nr:hypothetical protein [Pseudomonadota bacterium]
MRKSLVLFALFFSCAVMACNEGIEICAPHCDAGKLLYCNDTGIVEDPCPYGCKNNACIPAEAAQCEIGCLDARTQKYCEADGSQAVRTCAFSCENGACVEP